MGVNEDEDVCYPQPRTLDERLAVATDFVERFDLTLPLAVDGMENEAMRAYSAWPERLYVLRADGTLAYKGGMGPMWFEPDEVEEWLQETFAPEAERAGG